MVVPKVSHFTTLFVADVVYDYLLLRNGTLVPSHTIFWLQQGTDAKALFYPYQTPYGIVLYKTLGSKAVLYEMGAGAVSYDTFYRGELQINKSYNTFEGELWTSVCVFVASSLSFFSLFP